jgi:putative endonuclease
MHRIVGDDRVYAVYMLASKPYGTLYIGVTGSLFSRVTVHRQAETPGFTKKYRVHRLVWFEYYAEVTAAIRREKTMKHWPRQWKINLIERQNPNWEDLYPSLAE